MRTKAPPTTLLLDIGNTHTHVGLADGRRVVRHRDLATAEWLSGSAYRALRSFVGRGVNLSAAALCSVVPAATPLVTAALGRAWGITPVVLGPETIAGVGIDYPKPASIGPDRLANAIALRHLFGAPGLVVDFGTAVTFDIVDRRGCYVGGVIAPGLAAMTDYLHEKTALLPRIQIRDPRSVIGRSTEEAMLIGAVHGYRGLVRELIGRIRSQLRARQLPVVATGGYARLIAKGLPEITAVEPLLTLEGLRLLSRHHVAEEVHS
ncbi:MAG TPA: type III pantothenate kinase [Verrucomicrobiales bacterium]|nr:type III pantothenate kinase [Verrucomicrobiales bacterium]